MNSAAIGELSPVYYFQPNETIKSKTNDNRFHRFHLPSYTNCEYLWSYLGKLASITRNFLNVAARTPPILIISDPCFPQKVKGITTQMKLLSIIGVPFSLVDIKSTAQKTFKSFLQNDKEGVALGTISVSILAADIVDSITTFVNSALMIASVNTVSFFSALSLPLGFLMSGMGTVSRTIQIAKGLGFHKELNHEILSNDQYKNKILLKKFLEKKLGIEEDISNLDLLSSDQIQKLKEKKKVAILRTIPKEAVKELEDLLIILETDLDVSFTENKLKDICNSLDKIQKIIQKKLKVDFFSIIANLFVITALALFSVGSAGPLPFLFLAIGFIIRLAVLVYQDRFNKIN